MTRFSEATAHMQQLLALGATQESALLDTQRAFDLDDLTMDILEQNLEYNLV